VRGAWLALAVTLALGACSAERKEAAAVAPVPPLAPADLAAFFDCVRTEGGALVAAHRGGAAAGFAENSIAAFERTLAAAPAIIEADVRMSADGALVLMHDETVDRTTNGTGRVADLTLAQLQALSLKDAGGRVLEAHPPSLRQALDWARGRTILELDVKRAAPLERAVEAVREAEAQNRVVIVVYSEEDAITVHRLDPSLMISAPIDGAADLDRLREAHVDLTRVLAWTGTAEPNSALNVALARRAVEVIFGTVGPAQTSWDARFAREGDQGYAAFAETGLEVIVTDRPEAAYRALDQWDGEGWAPGRCLGR
jgi:glycerophosphoryl diester phosphodiesterase